MQKNNNKHTKFAHMCVECREMFDDDGEGKKTQKIIIKGSKKKTQLEQKR
jgi:hypothetical protein